METYSFLRSFPTSRVRIRQDDLVQRLSRHSMGPARLDSKPIPPHSRDAIYVSGLSAMGPKPCWRRRFLCLRMLGDHLHVLDPKPTVAAHNGFRRWPHLERNCRKVVQRQDLFLKMLIVFEVDNCKPMVPCLVAIDSPSVTTVLVASEVLGNRIGQGLRIGSASEHVTV